MELKRLQRTLAELGPRDSDRVSDRDRDDYWQRPPTTPPNDESRTLLWVDLRFNVFKVNAVNTVAGTAYVKVESFMYWTDTRLVDWPRGKPLPPTLWGPRLRLDNAMGDLHEVDTSFKLQDCTTGRMGRGRMYTATVDNPMDLRAFPFDVDRIELDFASWSNWESVDGGLHGAAVPKTYQLREVREPGEGTWLTVYSWNGSIAEWELHGVSSNIEDIAPIAGGSSDVSVGNAVALNFHVTRKSLLEGPLAAVFTHVPFHGDVPFRYRQPRGSLFYRLNILSCCLCDALRGRRRITQDRLPN